MNTKQQKIPKEAQEDNTLSQQQMLLIGLGGGIALGVGVLAYRHFKNKAAIKRSLLAESIPMASGDTITPVTTSPISNGQFPIKRGDRGSLVAMLQQALMAKGGAAATIIKETSFRGGKVDGIFGQGTQRALQAAGFPSVISQSDFSLLVGKRSNGFDASTIAKNIIDAANSRNLFATISGLQKIASVDQYRQVSTYFQGVRINGIRVTSLVNALLSVAFKQKELEKVKIRAEFRRMGLKQNARGVWFIPNLGSLLLESNDASSHYKWNLAIAKRPTLLKAEDGSFIVPQLAPKTVIGYITAIQNGVTRILTQRGEIVYAPTKNLNII